MRVRRRQGRLKSYVITKSRRFRIFGFTGRAHSKRAADAAGLVGSGKLCIIPQALSAQVSPHHCTIITIQPHLPTP